MVKDNKLISILITNYNKEKFISKTINSCLIQNYRNLEILVFDDCSTDNSLVRIKRFKNIKIFRNKKKKFNKSPLNQIHGISYLFRKSKGHLIFLLDGDDEFKKNKVKFITNIFKSDKNLDFIQDQPFVSKKKKFNEFKNKKSFFFYMAKFLPY